MSTAIPRKQVIPLFRQLLHIGGGLAALAVLGWAANQPAYAPFARHGSGRMIFGGLLGADLLWILGCVLAIGHARKARKAAAHVRPFGYQRQRRAGRR